MTSPSQVPSDCKGSAPRRKVALALQGGGSHGAFTWGVLDRLLEDQTLEIIGITGTSAGAMNAVVLADGLLRGGPEGARQRLRDFWEAIGTMPGWGSLFWFLSGESQSQMRLEQMPPYMAWDALSRNLSPYDLNPTKFNPLRDPLTKLVDFDRLRTEKNLHVMVCATNVLTARRRVFTNEDISVDATLASACLPELFPAVEIDGQPYWDGGFSGNPAMFALIHKLPKCDMIVVRIDPIIRHELPRTPRDIHDRTTELSFNTTFWLEMSVLGFLLLLVEQSELERKRFGRFLFHFIEPHGELEKIAASTKLNASVAFLHYLFDLGRTAAHDWLAQHGEDIGKKSTIDLTKLVQNDYQLFRQSDNGQQFLDYSPKRR
jgi:NTE family protein